MARRGIPKQPVNWYLNQWMQACGVDTQAAMMERTGWSKATMSQLYNQKQGYSPEIVEAAAKALHIEVFELFMPPEMAMSMRRVRAAAAEIVKEPVPATTPAENRKAG